MFTRIFIYFLFSLIASTSFANQTIIQHRLEYGSSIADICRRLNLSPLFSEKGYVTQVIKLNPQVMGMGEKNIPPGTVIILPKMKIKKSPYWTIHNGFLYFKHNKLMTDKYKIKNTHLSSHKVPIIINIHSRDAEHLLTQKLGLSKDDISQITINFLNKPTPRDLASKHVLKKKVTPTALPKYSSWELSGGAGASLSAIELTDRLGKKQTIVSDQSWSITANLLHKRGHNNFLLTADYTNYDFQSASTTQLLENNVSKLNYEFSYFKNFSSTFYSGAGIGSSDMISFINSSSTAMTTLKQSRLYASITSGLTFFIGNTAADVYLKFALLNALTTNNIQFNLGSDASAGFKVSRSIGTSTDLVLSTGLHWRDEAAQIYTQTTTDAYFGFGLRWQL